MPYVRKTKRRPSVTRRARIAAITCAVVATGLTFGGLYLNQQETIAANAEAAAHYTPEPVEETTTAPTQSLDTTSEPAAIVQGTDDITISILGDSTGNGPGEWVDLWAQHLSARATVKLHMWVGEIDDWDPEPITYGSGERQITIWNGSMSGANYAYPMARLEVIQPERPDLTILNFGHNGYESPADVGSHDLVRLVGNQWGSKPVFAVTLQNPALDDRETRTAESVEAIRAWSRRASVPLIDVNSAFVERGDVSSLMADNVHPNDAGQQVWLASIVRALG